MTKKIITFGEILMRLSPLGSLRFSQADQFEVIYGGGEYNVAASLSQFGLPVEFVTRLPDNDFGDNVLGELRKSKVGESHIVKGGDRLGIYFLESGVSVRGGNVIYDRGHSAMAQLKPGMIDWDRAFEDAEWFHWSGITPAISQSAADACLEAVSVAAKKGLTISTDLNYRQKLWQYGGDMRSIMTELVQYCDVVLAHADTAELMLGLKVDQDLLGSEQQFREMSNQFQSQFPKVKSVITTFRTSHSSSNNDLNSMLFNDGKVFASKKLAITHIVDRVGGGDAFMGGLIYGLIAKPEEYQYTIDFATAAAAFKHTIQGDVNRASIGEIEKLMGGDVSGRVAR